MNKKKILLGMVAVLTVFAGQGMAEEKKSKEQIKKEAKERWLAKEEMKKNAKIQITGSEIQFLDDVRRVHKKEPLGTDLEVATETVQIGDTKKTHKVQRLIEKIARTNSDFKFVLIMINKTNRWLINENGEESDIEDGYVYGRIKYFDENGNLLFDKSMPSKRNIEGEPLISESGETVAVISRDTSDEFKETTDIVLVFDKKGNEIKRIPSDDEMDMGKVNGLESISPNGKYLAISIFGELGTINRFYNLKNKIHWELLGRRYYLLGISDDGIAKVDTGGGTPKEYIDLKQYIGD